MTSLTRRRLKVRALLELLRDDGPLHVRRTATGRRLWTLREALDLMGYKSLTESQKSRHTHEPHSRLAAVAAG